MIECLENFAFIETKQGRKHPYQFFSETGKRKLWRLSNWSKTALTTPSSTPLSSTSLPSLFSLFFLPLLPLWIPCSVVPSLSLSRSLSCACTTSEAARSEERIHLWVRFSVTRVLPPRGIWAFSLRKLSFFQSVFLCVCVCFLLRDSCQGCRLRSIFLGSRIAVLYSVKESNFDFSLVAPSLCCRGDNLIFI